MLMLGHVRGENSVLILAMMATMTQREQDESRIQPEEPAIGPIARGMRMQ